MKRLITFIIVIMILASIFNFSEAIKLVDDERLQAGIFDDLLENESVVAINPNKLFKATATNEDDMHVLVKKDLKDIFEKSNLTITNVKNKNGKIYNDTTAIGTGSTITADNQKQYKVVLYGDANGDGRICNSMDIDVIRQDYVFNNKAEDAYKIAADLQVDGILNVRDVQRMTKKYIGQLDEPLVTPFPESEESKEIILTPSEDFELGKGDSQTITADTDVEWSWDEESAVADVVVNDDGSITVTGENPGEIDITAKDENGNEKTITVTVIVAKLEIIDYTKTSVTVEATIEGKEILSVKHFYQIPAGYSQGEPDSWHEAKGTEPIYTYTNEELVDSIPYNLKAEITTTDGKVFETDMPQWLMGSVGPNPTIEVTATPNEDEVTIKVEVTNNVEVNKYSYTIQKFENNSYATIDSVQTEKSEYTFEGLEDGNYQVIAVVSTDKGAYAMKTVNFTIRRTKGTIEIVDYTKTSITVKASIEDKEIISVKHFYQIPAGYTQGEPDLWHEAKGKDAIYTYTNEELTNNIPYNFKAEITAKDGKVYETDITQWLMGNIGPDPEIIVTATPNEDEVTIKTEITNDVEVDTYSYTIQKFENNSYITVDSKKTNNPQHTFEGLEDGNYQVIAVTTTEKGAFTTKNENFTINKTKGTIEIADYTKTSITVKVSIKGKEIVNIKHFYREPPGYSNNNEWKEAGITKEAQYKYTNAILVDNTPYQFMAEITAADGKVYETDITSWLMGSVGNAPAIEVTATPNEDDVTIKTEVTNDVEVDTYSYTIQKFENNSYTTVNSIKTGNSEHTFEGLEDGNYQLIAVASTKKGAVSPMKFISFKIATLSTGETFDETEAVAKIMSTGEMFKTIQYAVNAVNEEKDTIKILKDIEESEKATINKNIIIDLNGKTINNYFEITNDVTITDNTSNAGTIDLLNNTLNIAISVIDDGKLTLENGVDIKAYTCAIECSGDNAEVYIKEANIEEDYGEGDFESEYAAIRILDGASLYISDNETAAKVNVTSARYAIYADHASKIEINNNQEENDDGYLYEIYGDIMSIYAKNNSNSKTQIEINGGRYCALTAVDRTVISLHGNIDLYTTAGIIGDLETGVAIRAAHLQPDINTYYIPKICINGSTKIFASSMGIYIGNSRYSVPNTDVELEIGTDDIGNSEDGVQIISQATGIYVGNYGQTNIKIGGEPDSGYNLDKLDFEQKSPMILAENPYRLGVAIDILSADSTTLELNCQAIIIWNGNYSISSDIGEITTANDESNYEIITDETVDEDRYLKAVYIKKK